MFPTESVGLAIGWTLDSFSKLNNCIVIFVNYQIGTVD